MEIEEIESRLQEIKNELQTRSDITSKEIEDRETEFEKLSAEKTKRIEEKRQKAIDAFNTDKGVNMENITTTSAQTRAEELVRTGKGTFSFTEDGNIRNTLRRAALLSTNETSNVETKIAKPTAVDGIYDNLYDSLGLINDVTVKSYTGFQTIVHSYNAAHLEASEHTEGNVPTESEADFKLIKVQPEPYSVISYVSNAIERTSPLDYESIVYSEAMFSLVSKVEEVIVNKIQTSVNTAGDSLCDTFALESDIDEKTLRKIVLNYRNGRKYKGIATLLLTREQLLAFGDVRGTSEKAAVYDISFNDSNTRGTIRDGGLAVNYIIVDDDLLDGCMLYGFLGAFELDTFGDMQVKVSEDYKFGEGLLAIRGECWIGGALTVGGAFEKVTIGA